MSTDFSRLKSPCCLIAEDSEEINTIYSALLKKNDINFVIAENGIKALEIIKEATKKAFQFDFFIIDIFMPEMDGIELMKELQKDINYKLIPILVSTSLGDLNQATKIVKDFNLFAYIMKPINSDRLMNKIKVLLKV